MQGYCEKNGHIWNKCQKKKTLLFGTHQFSVEQGGFFSDETNDPIPPPKIAMAQLVKVKREENIPVLSGRLVMTIQRKNIQLIQRP